MPCWSTSATNASQDVAHVTLGIEGQVFLVTGSPGGSRIIWTVFQQLMNVLYYDMNIAAATTAPRFHHQWYPDRLELEP